VIVKVGAADALVDSNPIEAPVPADFFETQVSKVAKGHDGRGYWGIKAAEVAYLVGRQIAFGAPLLNLSVDVAVHGVPVVASGHKDVFVAVQVDIEEQGRPRPCGCFQSA